MVLNFTGFVFTVFIVSYMKKNNNFCDSSILNLILLFNCLTFLNYQDKLERAKHSCILTSFHNRRNQSEWNLPVKPVNDLSLCVKMYKLFSVLCCFYKFFFSVICIFYQWVLNFAYMFTFQGDFCLWVFNFTIFFTIVKKVKLKTHEFKYKIITYIKNVRQLGAFHCLAKK